MNPFLRRRFFVTGVAVFGVITANFAVLAHAFLAFKVSKAVDSTQAPPIASPENFELKAVDLTQSPAIDSPGIFEMRLVLNELAERREGLKHGRAETESIKKESALADRLAEIYRLYDEQDYSSAGQLCEKLLKDAPDYSYGINAMGNIKRKTCRFEEAEQLYRRALARDKDRLGPRHPTITARLNNLGFLYADMRRYPKALKYFTDVANLRQSGLGASHPLVAWSLMFMADMKIGGNNFSARALFQEALEIMEKAYGADNPLTLPAIERLARLETAEKHYSAAQSLYRRMLSIREKASPADLTAAADIMMEIARLGVHQNRRNESRDLFNRCEKIYRNWLEANKRSPKPVNARAAMVHYRLGMIYSMDIRMDTGVDASSEAIKKALSVERRKSIRSYRAALDIQKRIFGDCHPDIAVTLINMGDLLEMEQEYKESETSYKQAMEIYEKLYGLDHPSTEIILKRMGDLASSAGDHSKSVELLTRAGAVREKERQREELAENLYDQSFELRELANKQDISGNIGEASRLYLKSLDLLERGYEASNGAGPLAPEEADAIWQIAEKYKRRNQNAEAVPLYERWAEYMAKVFGQDYHEMPYYLSYQPPVLAPQGKYSEAESVYERMISIMERNPASSLKVDENPDAANILRELGDVEVFQKKYVEAESHYRRALMIYDTVGSPSSSSEQERDPSDSECMASINRLRALYNVLHRDTDRAELMEYWLPRFEDVTYMTDPFTVSMFNDLTDVYLAMNRDSDIERIYRQWISAAMELRHSIFENAAHGPTLPRPIKAETFYIRCVAALGNAMGPENPKIASILDTLSRSYRSEGHKDIAASLDLRAYQIRKKSATKKR